MNQERIELLASELSAALQDEYDKKECVAMAQAKLEVAEAVIIQEAQDAGQIDGKNSDTRKAQRAAVVANSANFKTYNAAVEDAKRIAELATIERRRVDAVIELTKAWMYSQCGH